jgi:ribosome maturation factor RimP
MNVGEAAGHDPLEAKVRAIAQEAIDDPPFFLVGVSVRGREGARVVEVFVDRDGGISIDALAELSREIGFLLDAENVVKGRYHLTVSSPGADRPLTLPRQYRRHAGRPMRLVVKSPEGDDTIVRGVLTEASDDDVALTTDTDRLLRYRYADIVEARVELPW